MQAKTKRLIFKQILGYGGFAWAFIAAILNGAGLADTLGFSTGLQAVLGLVSAFIGFVVNSSQQQTQLEESQAKLNDRDYREQKIRAAKTILRNFVNEVPQIIQNGSKQKAAIDFRDRAAEFLLNAFDESHKTKFLLDHNNTWHGYTFETVHNDEPWTGHRLKAYAKYLDNLLDTFNYEDLNPNWKPKP